MPAAQPTAGVGGPAQALDQPVIAAAGDHRALGAEILGDELEGGVAVIIEAADQPRIARPVDPGGVEPGCHLGEIVGRLGREIIVDRRRAVDDRPILMLLAVEDPQRVLLEPLAALLGKIAAAGSEMLDQGGAPGVAGRRIAERVELELDPLADAELVRAIDRRAR